MTSFLDAPAPRWFTIAPHRPFLGDLANGIWNVLSPLGPEAVAGATVLLPNRRAVRALAEALVACSARRAILPPQIRALGDLDEDEPPFEAGNPALDLPPAISPGRRRFELAGIVAENAHLLERRLDAVSALDLADALARFLDACQIEEAREPIDVETLVEGDLAQHWRRSADFLKLALEKWPKRLAELGLMDLTARRVAMLRRLEARWREAPPDGVLIAAGSTGSTPATADLLAAVARSPRGCVVLPGLDLSLADSAWAEVGDQHPQNALKRLLDRARIGRGEVRPWPGSEEAIDASRWRRRVISEALRPADRTADWLKVIGQMRAEEPDGIAQGLTGLSVVSARTEDEAASAAALMLREALQTRGRTAALVTPDAALARRVTACLARWNIVPDSSVGQSLASSPAGVLASLTARQSIDPDDPVGMLAIVKHPLTRLGIAPDALQVARLELERHGLRGPRPGGCEALRSRLKSDAALDLLRRLQSALDIAQAPFALGDATTAEAARALAESLEGLALGPEGRPGSPWAGQAGEAVAAVFTSLMEETGRMPLVTRAGFGDLLTGLLARGETRPGGANQPRLRVLGVLEARLVRSDLLILAGLEEGVWPAPALVDPFLSRPMRENLGLPAPDRRIGLAAHDFAQTACASEVVLLQTERRGSSPAVQSRWLWRLRTLIAGAQLQPPGRPEVLAWARALDAPIVDPPASLRTAARPKPTPPVAARPRELPVTAVETWIRDPYALYARRILGLRPLDPPDAPVEARARGTAYHRALERVAAHELDDIAADGMIESLIRQALREVGMPEAGMAREFALAANVAPWILGFERRRRPGARLLVERGGRLTFVGPAGSFTVTARADRIEARGARADILDFKTGRAPSQREVEVGLAPQLTLTAAILAASGFADLGVLTPRELLYVRVSGGRIPGEELSRGGDDSVALADRALEGLKRRVARFDDRETAYVSKAASQFMADAGEFDHLARVWEWLVMGEVE